MELVLSKDQCCGCTACKNICPTDAITMISDKCGFEYPQIDEDKCIECGLCKKVCAFNEDYDKEELLDKLIVYGAKSKDEEVKMKSSSGGLFSEISDYVLSKNGVIYGAIYNDRMEVVHARATTKEERNKQRGSKYVQSILEDTFQDIKDDLNNDKYVLFVGTPCQVAGLQGYLGKHYNKLIKVDLLCHSAPSPKVYKDYLNDIEEKYSSKVKSYTFRGKGKRTISQKVVCELENGMIYKRDDIALDPFGYLFAKNKIVRPACFNCYYTNLERVGDITLADFWGVEKSLPELVDNTGTSLVLINTNKGKEIFEEVNRNLEYKESSIEKCPHFNLKRPANKPIDYDILWDDYEKNGYKYIAKKYSCDSFIAYNKVKMKRLIKSVLKK